MAASHFFSAPFSPLAWSSSSLFPTERIKHRPIAGYGDLRIEGTFSLGNPCHRTDVLRKPRPRISCAGLFRKPKSSFFSADSEKNQRERIIPQAGRSRESPRRYGKHLKTRKVRGNTEKKKPSGPYIKQPDDYYKFGPYGPYSYKAAVVGKIQPVTSWSDDYVFMWSTHKNLQDIEEAEIQNASVSYDRQVQTFDDSVGLQFFYVFARLPFKYENQPFWKEWSLVSEITVESGEVLDKVNLASRLGSVMMNRITKYTAWIRPDLVFVKKPSYQVRFEPQLEFIHGLQNLLFEAAGEVHEKDSYYGVFCRILDVDVNASDEEITSRYEKASEETRLACLEHLFSMHPIKLMYFVPYPHLKVWVKEEDSQSSRRERETDASTLGSMARKKEEEHFDTTEGTDDETEISEWTDDDNETENSYDNENESENEEWDDVGNESENDDMENESENDDIENESENDEWYMNSVNDFQKKVSRKGNIAKSVDIIDIDARKMVGFESKHRPVLKAAARPYTYVNFIREMVMLREIMLEHKKEAAAAQ